MLSGYAYILRHNRRLAQTNTLNQMGGGGVPKIGVREFYDSGVYI